MARLTHAALAELLGAYALDAVDAEEAEAIEAHLTVCPRCRDEVRDHREVASLLAYTGEVAPPGLWDKLVAALDDPAPPVDAPLLAPIRTLTPVPAPSGSWPGRRGAAMLSAAAAVLILLGAVGGLWVRNLIQSQEDQLEQVNFRVKKVGDQVDKVGSEAALSQAVLAANTTVGARTVRLSAPNNKVLADAVVTPDGSSYVWNVQLPALSADKAYQLWAVVGNGEKRSVGVLGNTPRVAAFNVPIGSVVALAITEEVASGVSASTKQAVAFGLVPGDRTTPSTTTS